MKTATSRAVAAALKQKRQMKLGAFLMTGGYHVAAWRHPKARRDATASIDHFIGLARLAELAKFDAIFLAEASGSVTATSIR